MRGAYALALLVSIGGLAIIDYRYQLAYFKHRRRTLQILAIAIVIFSIWDIAGILAEIFFIGQNNLLIGLRVGEFPLEEILFLALLNYSSLIIYLFIKQVIKQSGRAK